MAGKKQLPPVHLVGDGSGVEPEDHLANLKAMKRVLDSHIHNENTLARDLSPLVRQARDISREIAEIEEKLAAAEAEVVAHDDSSTDDAAFRLEVI